eukprot:TRINITY_DN35540_c0_g1_i1.p1 TRINITY_DN35540_c0_g1~~TRINITY_DN35540_c0_g1_i1.p1  ORF type:complete len:356 (+),score=51.96 TRINITY_DN35540_c0_g1_i1:47-1069(+)
MYPSHGASFRTASMHAPGSRIAHASSAKHLHQLRVAEATRWDSTKDASHDLACLPRYSSLACYFSGLAALLAANSLRRSRSRHPIAAVARCAAQELPNTSCTKALLFDCDGVILLTEELHRLAYNKSFEEFETGVTWSVEYYDVLQNTIGGGKAKMRHHFARHGWPTSTLGPAPESEEAKAGLVDALQNLKSEIYKELASNARPRPGILELMDQALDWQDLKTGICSASTKSATLPVLEAILGKERLAKFDLLLIGDDVDKKKPDPLIYTLAAQKLGVLPSSCAVIEDSKIGLQAAQGAQMSCYITCTDSTKDQDFSGAVEIVTDATSLSLDRILSGLPQ